MGLIGKDGSILRAADADYSDAPFLKPFRRRNLPAGAKKFLPKANHQDASNEKVEFKSKLRKPTPVRELSAQKLQTQSKIPYVTDKSNPRTEFELDSTVIVKAEQPGELSVYAQLMKDTIQCC
jgi:hypothetical protein